MSLIKPVRGCVTQSGLPPMKLHIEVMVSGDFAAPIAVYKLIAAEPDLDDDTSRHIVSPDGNIDLAALPMTAAFDPQTEITFDLVGTVNCHGADRPIRFRRSVRKAFRIRLAGGGRPTRGLFRAFFPNPFDRTILTVDDQNNDGNTYDYCLAIKAWGCPGHGKLDPSIINR